jgi:competence protein ComEC
MKMLLLDGSNSNRNIERFIKEAERMSLPYYVLKNNFAYVWVLDEES